MRQPISIAAGLVLCAGLAVQARQSQSPPPALPSMPMHYGLLRATFAADGTFTMGGDQWPDLVGTWKAVDGEVVFTLTRPLEGCAGPGRFKYQVDGRQVRFSLIADDCGDRSMMLSDSVWLPVGEKPPIPPRNIVRTGPARPPVLPPASSSVASWSSFRGPHASGIADGVSLPDTWDVTTGDGVLWRTPIEGLGHSSPVVWGDTVFVATAVSSLGKATFKPGLYGAGTASEDRTSQQWKLIALDKRTGKVKWSRVAAEGVPIDKRHVKSTYASATPATNGQIVVATAVSSLGKATFKPGLYGAGTASDDRTSQQWKLIAIDKRTGKMKWSRVAAEGVPIDKRHVKSTYASATPATNGQIVVATFGSMGAHAFDMEGNVLWTVDYGRVNLGAYDLPSWEWGPASSPIIWNDLVILQVDTHADSFVLALNAKTGETVWKTDRDEIPSWGTPTVADTPAGPTLVTNASNFVRGYDPRTGKELWKLGPTSKITAPTPIFADGLWVVASGRAPERPIYVIKPDAAGDLSLVDGQTSNSGIAWSKTARGPYMPTPLAYRGQLYVLANNGIFDAHDLQTGKEIYRQRLPDVGSGFSASPVAADGKIYLSGEDGDILVIQAGSTFSHIATNTMGDLIMATPALSDGAMYVRTAGALFAIGRQSR